MELTSDLWRVERDIDGIAHVILDVPGQSQNTLNQAVLDGFEQVLRNLEAATPKAVFLKSAKPAGFMAGADIGTLSKLTPPDLKHLLEKGHRALARLEKLDCPTVAVIHGACLGGGLEVALACDHRVCERGTQFGFPEVQLGLHPGLGGTYRFPALVGPSTALPFMLTGRSISAGRAKSIGLVRDAVEDRHLHAAAHAAASAGKKKQKPVLKRMRHALETSGLAKQLIAKRARKQTASRVSAEHYSAPFAMIDLFERDLSKDSHLEAEAASFAELSTTNTSKNLIALFERREALKREARTSGGFGISHVHVIGAGTMGADIAMWTAMQGFTVTLQDVDAKPIAKAMQRAAEWMDGKSDRSDDIRPPYDRLIPDPSGDGVASADLIIEAGPEKAEVKQKIYDGLLPKLKPGAIIATNTSSIRLEELAGQLPDAGRFVGLHFFNPVTKMPLVEVVKSEQTSDQTMQRALAFTEAIDKLPLPVKSAPGFLVNRILTPYLLEAVKLMEDGYKPEEIDAAAERFGMAQGPVEVADTVGLDICLEVGRVLSSAFDHIPAPPARLERMVNSGDLGKKTGKGFYSWKKGKPQKDNVEMDEAASAEIQARLIEPMLNEAKAAFGEGVVSSSDHLDLGAVFGSGFAPFRGGPCTYMNARKSGGSDISETASAGPETTTAHSLN